MAANARILSEHGTRVVCGAIEEEGARQVAEQTGGWALYLDVAEPTSAEATVKEILGSEGRIDILVTTPVSISSARRRRCLWPRGIGSSTSTFAPPGSSRAWSLRTWSSGKRPDHQRLITASKKGWEENATAYAASKHGVMGLTQTLHVEGKAHGIRVMAVVAGG
jgi:NAD(P)-dependent dehydrogenase (short-subunit alcohol dehydrogenase family)